MLFEINFCIYLVKKIKITYKFVTTNEKKYTSKDTCFLLPPFPLSDAGMEHITMNRKSKQAALTNKLD